MLAALIAATGVTALESSRMTGVGAPVAGQQPSSAAAPARPLMESAVERRDRLMGTTLTTWTPMRAALREPRIGLARLRQTSHGGHEGLFTSRPQGYKPVAIVLHATGSGELGSEFVDLASLGAFFQRQGVAASHYGIARDGSIAQYVDDGQAAFHVARPGWNGISIGVELLNDNSGAQPFTSAQLRAARDLVLSLGARYGIPVEAVVQHRDIQPEDRSDPAANFPWSSFRRSLAPAVASGAGRRLVDGASRLDLGARRAVDG